MAEKMKPGLSFEQLMLAEVPNATYGELVAFGRALADRISDAKQYDREIDGELLASILHAWSRALDEASHDR